MSETESGPERLAIGISFGNSNSSIAFTGSDGKAEVIANEEGDRQIPSVISYINGEEYGGAQAKAQLVRNPENTVAYFRDFIGKPFKSIDPTHCHASAHPIDHGSEAAFSIHDQTEAEDSSTVTVSEVITRHFRRIVVSASDFLGKPVTAAVVTVPTDFAQEQQKALEVAAKNADLEVLQIIHEPTAALLAYDARPESKLLDKNVVVADLGGTRSDVAIIASRGGMYTTLSTAHDDSLGGASLDQLLIDHFAKEFIKKHKNDPRNNPRSLAKLKLEAEACKKALSLGNSAPLSVESLLEGQDFSSTINRSRYEIIAGSIFQRFTALIQEAIQKADLDILNIDEVILSGGTAHTPKIARMLSSLFPENTPILAPSTSPTAINPSELAARGAAIQASLIQEYEKEDIDQSTHPMVTVTSHIRHPIGVLTVSAEESEAIFRPIIFPETPVPARRTANVAAPKLGGDLLVRIAEGESWIKVEKPPAKPKRAESEAEDSEEEEDDEEEEVRERMWRARKVLAEAEVKGVKKGGKVEVILNVGADFSLDFIVREVGSKTGVRGKVEVGKAEQNGTAK